MSAADHWERVHASRDHSLLSWYQSDPEPSLGLVRAVGLPGGRVVEVGGGTSHLVDHLVADGYRVTVVDISATAIATTRRRLGDIGWVTWVVGDILSTSLDRHDVWHDRAVLHFLVDDSAKHAYRERLLATIPAGGAAVIGTFAPDGPTTCSGLPVLRYSATDLAAFLAPEFHLVESTTVDHETPDGRLQPFMFGRLRRP
jgi:SAM-dependent methyltransferase